MIGLNATCHIMRASSSAPDNYGVEAETLTTGTEDCACRFIEGDYNERARLVLEFGAQMEIATTKVLFADGVDVQASDRLLTGTDYYEVLSVVDVDHWGHHQEVWVSRLEGRT